MGVETIYARTTGFNFHKSFSHTIFTKFISMPDICTGSLLTYLPVTKPKIFKDGFAVTLSNENIL